MKRRITDNRRNEKYMIDDEYLNDQAKLCGWQGTIVYNSLCRHANKDQECFPSIKLMSEQHGVSRPTILKGIDNLERRKVIVVQKHRTEKGNWLNNTYILTDKSEWDYTQVNDVDTDKNEPIQVNENTHPSQRGDITQVNDVDTKETHREGNTYKETHIAKNKFSQDIPKIIEKFKELSPSLTYGNRTQRKACEEMITKWGIDKTLRMVDQVLQAQMSDQFCPKAVTPLQMWQKIGGFKVYFQGKMKSGIPTFNE